MPKCSVTTINGEHLVVEADDYELLRESGFVILKRVPAEGRPRVEITVGLFYRPAKVLMEPPAVDIENPLSASCV